jgi:alpha-galactosidase
MIHYNENDQLFHLQSDNCSYMLHVLPTGHIAHLYYGKKIRHNEIFENFIHSRELSFGSTTSYNGKNHGFSLNHELLEYSSYGKGDYREPSISLHSEDGNRTFDFLFREYSIQKSKIDLEGLPSSRALIDDEVETLELTLTDSFYELSLVLTYNLFPK